MQQAVLGAKGAHFDDARRRARRDAVAHGVLRQGLQDQRGNRRRAAPPTEASMRKAIRSGKRNR